MGPAVLGKDQLVLAEVCQFVDIQIIILTSKTMPRRLDAGGSQLYVLYYNWTSPWCNCQSCWKICVVVAVTHNALTQRYIPSTYLRADLKVRVIVNCSYCTVTGL